ncbi:hypothetical protein QR680_008506 [Steinernema hermaphroditum]|uniref:Serpentine receptor class gamma n=1 Tax=Steinernema hermaphroditum TaxID=289476 RepID=A0AA39M7S5_9BILA|nr:hypothetical protein QR680_008506 [Steinernema hermaphroditum]
MNAEVARLSVSLLYGVPSLVLYATVLVQLFRPKHKKHFDNPFFKLCFLIGVVECIGYLEFYLFFTLPTYSLFSKLYGSLLFSPSAFTTTIYFLNYFLGYLQLFGSCFLTFNRFTSVVFPLKHDKIWRFCFPLSIVATVLSAAAPCWYLTTTEAWYDPIHDGFPEEGYAMATDNDKYPFFSNSFNKSLSNFVACVLCLAMNTTSAIFLFLRTPTTNRRAEMNLFFVALMIFAVQSIHGLHQVLIYISMAKKNTARVKALYTLLPWINDLKFLSPPWVLVIVSSSVRRAVLQVFPRRLMPNRNSSGSIAAVTKIHPSSIRK